MSSNQRKKRRAIAKQIQNSPPPKIDIEADKDLEKEIDEPNTGFRGDLALLTFIVFNIPLIVAITFLSTLLLPHYWILIGDALIVVSLYYSRIYFLRWSAAYIRSRNKWVFGLNVLVGIISVGTYVLTIDTFSSNNSESLVSINGRPDFSYEFDTFKYIITAKGLLYLFYDEFLRHGPLWKEEDDN